MEGDLQHVLGHNLRTVRTRMGLSQEGMAAHLGWHRTYVGAVERGERNLSLRSVERLGELLDMDPVLLLRNPA